jgi:hypothetical protein
VGARPSTDYGSVLLLGFHNPPYLLIATYAAAVLGSATLVWIGRRTGSRLIMEALGLAHATVGAKARFTFYWLVSLGLVLNALWPKPDDFNTICGYGWKAASDLFDGPGPTTSLEGIEFAECKVNRQGNGYGVTIGKVSLAVGDRRTDIMHLKAVIYPNGSVHHIELIPLDPRADTNPSVPSR